MKYNAVNLIRRGADALQRSGDASSAYALHELANNLLEVMDGRSSMADWSKCYTATGCKPLDLEKQFPSSSDAD